ncbi:MAG: carboxylating nicotinate-nucleotide diphosphorylase [Deltaproteobacteria bacterium]|jgi:nicotinate-nucleotide pyrophosphorylase (carboxylating)|nr:carboxylating nicotinate-nucleotide diphosphorylase [Deltaproteobacteria bacterium]
MSPGPSLSLCQLIDLALAEDLGPGDVTSRLTVPPERLGRAQVRARRELVISGLAVFEAVFARVDPQVEVRLLAQEGELLAPGQVAVEIAGPAISLLAGERVGLNFLIRLSGVATWTRQFVQAVGPVGPTILDTRKTTPGWRALEKAAVTHGGGRNHRFGLFDGIMIKDNHIAAVGSLEEAVRQAKRGAPMGLKVEVEVDSLGQIEPALRAGADILLLDNMSPQTLIEAVRLVESFFAPGPRRALLEASGGINLTTIEAVAKTGVDFISVGALTHSAPAVDLGLDWRPEGD